MTEENWTGYAEAWSSHDVDRIASFFTDDCSYEDVALGVENRGKEELKGFARATFAAFPDFAVEPRSLFSAGGWTATEWVMSGTHRGDLPGLAATGKSFSVRGASIMELQGGKIQRNSDYWNMASFLRQIGVMPEEPPAAEALPGNRGLGVPPTNLAACRDPPPRLAPFTWIRLTDFTA